MTETTPHDDDTWITYVDDAAAGWTLSLEDLDAAREERLIERQDWGGLIRLRQRQFDECPCPLCATGYAEALIAGSRWEEAIEVLRPTEQERPGDPLVTELILNALHFLDRNVEDFAWTLVPRLVHLDEDALELCRHHLARGAKEVTVGALRLAVFAGAYLDFSVDQLAAALGQDERFQMGTDQAGNPTVLLLKDRPTL